MSISNCAGCRYWISSLLCKCVSRNEYRRFSKYETLVMHMFVMNLAQSDISVGQALCKDVVSSLLDRRCLKKTRAPFLKGFYPHKKMLLFPFGP